MRITSANYSEVFSVLERTGFYKATSGGVQKCVIVKSYNGSLNFSEKSLDWGPEVEIVEGYVVDSLFHKIREGYMYIDANHFDQPQNGFFTTEEEATEFHRELVLNYIRGLNASSLKSHPIEAA